MYPHFIKLHDLEARKTLWFNIDNIETFYSGYENPETSVINMVSRELYCVEESCTEIEQLLRDAGCNIRKADPRLDTTHPLTLEELQEMAGEPAWSSYDRDWYLVHAGMKDIHQLNDDEGKPVIRLVNSKGNADLYASADDLIKYPLYRMKQD